MSPSKYQAIVNVVERWSDRNSEEFYEIEIIDNDTGKMRITYVSESNFNSKPWLQAVKVWQKIRNQAVIISSDKFKVKKKPNKYGFEILNADSNFEYEGVVDLDDYMNDVLERVENLD